MKNFKNKISAKVQGISDKAKKLTVQGYWQLQQMKMRTTDVLCTQSGEGFVDTALKILISVVVGALLLAGLYMLFNDTILPTLTQRIKDLFNYKG
ncbi:hypothetical protein LAD12857_35280 [Lacrimispora amygdalina]|uniref:Uncharacterized protein n=1 Tax=Lacrimispora amygdalina TaxID=253257 RepID=A0ABQ5MA31_9FIRM|nr:DUF6133 family protein [Lacrimispora defluvii]